MCQSLPPLSSKNLKVPRLSQSAGQVEPLTIVIDRYLKKVSNKKQLRRIRKESAF